MYPLYFYKKLYNKNCIIDHVFDNVLLPINDLFALTTFEMKTDSVPLKTLNFLFIWMRTSLPDKTRSMLEHYYRALFVDAWASVGVVVSRHSAICANLYLSSHHIQNIFSLFTMQ